MEYVRGGYFSEEQIDLLSIIEFNDLEKLIEFVKNTVQLNGVFTLQELESFKSSDIEEVKKRVFKSYQDTLVSHDSLKEVVLNKLFTRLNLDKDTIEFIKSIYLDKERYTKIREYIERKYPNYREIFTFINRCVTLERDQNKSEYLYEELSLLSKRIDEFSSMTFGSLKPETVINEFFGLNEDERYDYYFALRDLEYAKSHNKHVRLHTLLSKNANEEMFNGKSKEEILTILKEYVKKSIDFINDCNSKYTLSDGTPVINAIDVFNEIVSFEEDVNGEYYNIWERKYGITIKDLCDVFSYAQENKQANIRYLYNEPFLENDKRREKVFQILNEIRGYLPNLIDTLGSQMHITIDNSEQIYKENEEKINDFFIKYATMRGVSEEKVKKIVESGNVLNILKSEIENGKIDRRYFEDLMGKNIVFGTSLDSIKRCFNSFYDLQNKTNVGIEVTEFDSSLSTREVLSYKNNLESIPYADIYKIKYEQLQQIKEVILDSQVKLNGFSYWSLTDRIDTNLERIISTLLKEGIIKDVNELKSVCGGLFSTEFYEMQYKCEENKVL